MTQADCLAEARRPQLEEGDMRYDGRYARNCPKEGVPKRYPQDNEVPPEFGRRVKERQVFNWSLHAPEGQRGLSTNCMECVRTPCCSLLINANEHHTHVVIIDLENLSDEIAMELAAQYAPLENNPCHFNIVPTENDLEFVRMALEDLMRDAFPKAKKKPHGEDAVKARELAAHYHAIFEVVIDPCDEGAPEGDEEPRLGIDQEAPARSP